MPTSINGLNPIGSRLTAHAGLRLRNGGLELLGAAAVDLGDRFLHCVDERRINRVRLSAVVDGDDAGRAGRQRGAHLLPEAALDAVFGEPADHATGGAGDDHRRQQRRGKRPTTSPTPAPTLAPLRPRSSPVSWTLALPSVSTVTSATPSTSSCLSSTSLTSALKSCWARSGIRYAAMTTSKSVSLIVFFLREHSMVVLCVDRVRGECLVDLLMQLPLVLLADVWVDVEDDPLDGAGERER